MSKIKCPNCGYEGQPMKSPSMAGALLLGLFYAAYYYWFKGRFCASCGRSYSNEELKAQSYADPDNTYKIIMLVIIVLWVIGIMSIFSYF